MATTFTAGTSIKSAEVNANFLEKTDKATLTTKGDSYVATGAGVVVRQGVGADGTFPFADAAQTNGMRYVHGLGDVQTKTTTYGAVMTDAMVLCSTAGGAWTLTFPTAVSCSGKIIGCKKTTSDFSAVTLAGTGMSTNYLMTIGETAWFQSDGTNWIQIERKTDTAWIAYTPTFVGLGTVTSIEAWWKRTGDSIICRGRFSTGTATAVTATITIPNSSAWTIAAGITTQSIFGHLVNNSLANNFCIMALTAGTTFSVGNVTAPAGLVAQLGTVVSTAGSQAIGWHTQQVPITNFSA